MDAEEQRVNDARENLARRITQTESDAEREQRLEADAASALQRLGDERTELMQMEAADAEAGAIVASPVNWPPRRVRGHFFGRNRYVDGKLPKPRRGARPLVVAWMTCARGSLNLMPGL